MSIIARAHSSLNVTDITASSRTLPPHDRHHRFIADIAAATRTSPPPRRHHSFNAVTALAMIGGLVPRRSGTSLPLYREEIRGVIAHRHVNTYRRNWETPCLIGVILHLTHPPSRSTIQLSDKFRKLYIEIALPVRFFYGTIRLFIGEQMSSQNPGCLAALFGLFTKKQTQTQTQEQFPYRAKQFFFTNAEASFYHFLRKMAGEAITVFPHVLLSDLVSVSGVEKTESYKFRNKIDRKQVDFVLVDSKTLRPVLVIELDDSTHQRADRIDRDRFVEKVLETARIPIARVPVRPSYDARELGELFKTTIQTNQAKITKAKEGDS